MEVWNTEQHERFIELQAENERLANREKALNHKMNVAAGELINGREPREVADYLFKAVDFEAFWREDHEMDEQDKELVQLRAQVAAYERWAARMPDAGLTANDPRFNWYTERPQVALDAEPADNPKDELICNRCEGRNISWAAPSPLWNAVMRGGSIDGDWQFGEIICPICFVEIAEQAGIADLWVLNARRVNVELETVTPTGRVWNNETMLWDEPADNAGDAVPETMLGHVAWDAGEAYEQVGWLIPEDEGTAIASRANTDMVAIAITERFWGDDKDVPVFRKATQ